MLLPIIFVALPCLDKVEEQDTVWKNEDEKGCDELSAYVLDPDVVDVIQLGGRLGLARKEPALPLDHLGTNWISRLDLSELGCEFGRAVERQAMPWDLSDSFA